MTRWSGPSIAPSAMRKSREKAMGPAAPVTATRTALLNGSGVGDLNQVKDDPLVGSEHRPVGDAEEQGVADGPCGAGDGDPYGIAHVFISSMTASANSDVPTALGSSRVGLRS